MIPLPNEPTIDDERGERSKKKVIKKRIIIKNAPAPNLWPYSDSYAPNLKMIEDDKPKIKQRLHKANVKGLLAFE